MSFHISQLAGAAAGVVGGAALGAVVTSVVGGAAKKSTIIAATKDYTLRQSASGHLSVHRRTPKRRFHSRSSGGQLNKLMELAIISSAFKK